MANLQLNFLKIMVLSFLLQSTLNQPLVNFENGCACEELQFKNECEQLEKCSFKNSKCVTLACSKINTKAGCLQNENCSWNNNQCVYFLSCSFFNAGTNAECENMKHGCFYNSTSQKCQIPVKSTETSCTSNSVENCYLGYEGVCALYGKTQCQEMIECSQADGDILRCNLAKPACIWNNESSVCQSAMTCKEAYPNNCQFAKQRINGNWYYLCNVDDCSAFQPLQQTKSTCLLNSLGYYHWLNEECTQCIGSFRLTLGISLLFSYLLIL